MTLPPPDTVLASARQAGTRAHEEGLIDDEFTPNLIVEADDAEPAIDRTERGFVGEDATELGLLAVASKADNGALHFPEPDLTAPGPWLVLEPLSGLISTVHRGTGRVSVKLDYEHTNDHYLATVGEHVNALLAAARPSHDRYPVADDSKGIFRTGMTEFEVRSVGTTETTLTASFEVLTTPSTAKSAVIATFEQIDGVVDVAYEAAIGVERAAPSRTLRSAVEKAHRQVLGDAGYEWYPLPTVFSRLPSEQKIALGTGSRTDDRFSNKAYATGTELLAASLSNLGENI